MEPDVIYQYADGNGNLYTLRGSTLTYAPVKPIDSSTGTYSGGEPKTVVLTSQEKQSVTQLLERAMSNRQDQIENREKGTGAISIITGSKKQYCILRRSSTTIAEIESLLKDHLK